MSYLTIDVGSSSVRVLLLDAQATPIPGASAQHAHKFSANATADAIHLRELVETCIDTVLAHPAASAIQAVGMATFVGNLLGVDAANTPITPVFTYADRRSHADATALAQTHTHERVHARTGCRIHPAYHPAKLHWLQRTQPQTVATVHRWLDFATYCYQTWFGQDVPCSYSVASWSGLLNGLTWDAEWLEVLNLSAESLPTLADFDTVQQGLTDSYADRWSLLGQTPFYLAVGDGAAANIGTGGLTSDAPVLTVGTTAAMRVVTPSRGDPPISLWAYRVDADRHLIGGATSEGGNIFAWARDTLKLDLASLEDALLTREPGAHALTVLPLLAGERSPGYQAGATGTLHGLRLDTTPLDMIHALLEGVALRLRHIYDLLDSPDDGILASGGALMNSPAWAQIIADALGVPLHLVQVPEATARGIAILLGAIHHPAPQRIITPRAASTQHMAALLHAQQQLYKRLYTD